MKLPHKIPKKDLEPFINQEKKSFTLEEMVRDYRYHKNPILHWVLKYFNYYKNRFQDVKYAGKNHLQKLTRGYADSECWNLPQATSQFMLPRLKHLRKKYHSLANRHHLITEEGSVVPYEPNKKDLVNKHGELYDKKYKKFSSLSKQEYEQVLDEIIFALQLMVDEENLEIDLYERYQVYPNGMNERKMLLTETEKDGEKVYDVEFKGSAADYSQLDAAYERQRKGFILLGLYFRDLWD